MRIRFDSLKSIINFDSIEDPKSRIKARIVIQALFLSWLFVILCFFIFNLRGLELYQTIFFSISLGTAIVLILYTKRWKVAAHLIVISILSVILTEIAYPGSTTDMQLVQNVYIVIFYSFYIIEGKWGGLYSLIAILAMAWIVYFSKPEHLNSYNKINFYIIVYSFLTIFLSLFKYLSALNEQVNNLEKARENENQFFKNFKLAAQKAKNLDKKKSLFFSTISHELRTPLNAIVGFSNLLMHGSSETISKENLNLLHFSTEYLASTVNNVMETIKKGSVKDTLGESTFELIPIVEKIYRGLKMKSDVKQVNLTFNYSESLKAVKVIGLKDRLVQIIYNLIDNAIKFTRKGSVSIEIISLQELDQSIKVRFKIQDTGIGIAQDQMKDIFKPFTQASEKINREFGGTGLGLSIVDKLLKSMKSEIHCESELNKGATFSFEVLFQLCNHNTSILPINENSVYINQLDHFKVLIAEDNDLNVRLICKILDQWKITYDVAVNGMEALEKAKDKHYDAILMDVNMPIMNGIEASKEIKILKPHQAIVFLTANIQHEVIDEMIELNTVGSLIKPFNAKELEKILYKIKVDQTL